MPQITVNIPECNALEQKVKQEALENVAKLSADDAKRINELAKSPKALKALKSKWTMLKAMFV